MNVCTVDFRRSKVKLKNVTFWTIQQHFYVTSKNSSLDAQLSLLTLLSFTVFNNRNRFLTWKYKSMDSLLDSDKKRA